MQYTVQGISKRTAIISATGDWLRKFSWHYICTFTFKKDISTESAERRFQRYMFYLDKNVHYFYVIEKHSTRRCDHIHCVIGYSEAADYDSIQNKWRRDYGIVKVELYDESKGGLYYLCKRIADERTEWGFKLNQNESN